MYEYAARGCGRLAMCRLSAVGCLLCNPLPPYFGLTCFSKAGAVNEACIISSYQLVWPRSGPHWWSQNAHRWAK
eukprot:7360139-Prymnesium_polylepis.1